MRPRSVPMALKPFDCIIAVKSAAELEWALKEHAGKVSCVITAFGRLPAIFKQCVFVTLCIGTCQVLQAELGAAVYQGENKDRVRVCVFVCVLSCV